MFGVGVLSEKNLELNPSLKIIKTLLLKGELNWSELKQETGLSNGALSKHVNLLFKQEFILIYKKLGQGIVYQLNALKPCPVCGTLFEKYSRGGV